MPADRLAYLSKEWFAALRDATAGLQGSPGVTGTVQVDVLDSPAGTVTYGLRVADGRICAASLGPPDDPDVLLRLSRAESVRVHKAETTYQEAYDQGALEVAGDWALAIDLSMLSEGEEFLDALLRVSANTRYERD